MWVYIMASRSRCLYIGVTNDIVRRVAEHREGLQRGFSAKYHTHRLVYLEPFPDPISAIAREKQLKRWRREKKIWLIERSNPEWHDLAAPSSRAEAAKRPQSRDP